MTTKHKKVVTHRKGLPPINSYNPSLMCLPEANCQIKNIMSPLSQCLWSQELSGWYLWPVNLAGC